MLTFTLFASLFLSRHQIVRCGAADFSYHNDPNYAEFSSNMFEFVTRDVEQRDNYCLMEPLTDSRRILIWCASVTGQCSVENAKSSDFAKFSSYSACESDSSTQLRAVLKVLQLANETLCDFSGVEWLDIGRGIEDVERLGSANCQLIDESNGCFYRLKYLSWFDPSVKKLRNDSFCQFQMLQWQILDSDGINEIEVDAFVYLKRLTVLTLNANHLTSLDHRVFRNNSRLSTLGLHGNRLRNAAFLRPLRRLCVLDLGRNQLEDLNPQDLEGKSELKNANFARNKLRGLNFSFPALNQLQVLLLNGNAISKIDAQAFHRLPALSNLNLSRNELETLHANAFAASSNLLKLDLSHNRLKRFPNVSKLELLRSLNVSHNRLRSIQKSDLIGNVGLKELSLLNNDISHIETSAFDGMNLAYLDLSHNQLIDLSFAFQSAAVITRLNLDHNNVTAVTLTADNFKSEIKILSLRFNQIKVLKLDYRLDREEGGMISIEQLYFSHNQIATLEDVNVPISLKEFHVNHNDIERLTMKRVEWAGNNLRLVHFNVQSNKIRSLCLEWFAQLVPRGARIKYHVSGNPLECNCQNGWVKFDESFYSDKHFSIADSSLIRCRPFSVSSEKTNRVNLLAQDDDNFLCSNVDGGNFDDCACAAPQLNTINCVKHFVPSNCKFATTLYFTLLKLFCNDTVRIENSVVKHDFNSPIGAVKTFTKIELYLYNYRSAVFDAYVYGSNVTKFYLTSSNLRKIRNGAFNNFERMVELNLSRNRLEDLPDKLFDRMTLVETVDLSDNRLTTLPKNAFANQNQLRFLFLHDNRFNTIYFNDFYKLKSIATLTLTLHGNPWSCECNFVQPFRNYLSFKPSKVLNFGDIDCSDGHTLSNIIKYDVSICLSILNTTALYVSITFATLLFSVSVLVFVYRREAQVLIYSRYGLRMFHRKQLEEEVEGKQYDAFMAYNSKDEDFLVNELMPGLEAIPNPYRLCIHERDFPGGSYIQDSILEAIRLSSRTIVILSENFVQSGWCRYEFKSAHLQMLEDRCPRLLVIVFGKIPESMDPEMQLYLKTNTYLKWGESLFWNKLYYAMPDQRVTTPATEIMPMREF